MSTFWATNVWFGTFFGNLSNFCPIVFQISILVKTIQPLIRWGSRREGLAHEIYIVIHAGFVSPILGKKSSFPRVLAIFGYFSFFKTELAKKWPFFWACCGYMSIFRVLFWVQNFTKKRPNILSKLFWSFLISKNDTLKMLI